MTSNQETERTVDLSHFLDQLDQLDDNASREALYGAHDLELPIEAVRDAVAERRPCSAWLWPRRLAGPPGTMAPKPDEQCFERLFANTATILDAYSILYQGGPHRPHEDAAVVMRGCAGAAWRTAGGNYLSARMAVWSALASFAAGENEPLLALAQLGNVLPGDQEFAPLKHLLETPDLASSVYARRAVAGNWTGPPAFPELAAPRAADVEMGRGEWVRAVEDLEDEALATWAQVGLANWDVRVAERLEEHATIQAIRQAALDGTTTLAADLPIPPDFESWLIAAVGRRQDRAARVGAIHAWRQDATPIGLLLPAVMNDLRIEDLDLMLDVIPEGLRSMFEELRRAVADLPEDVGADLVILASPQHADHQMAAGRLTAHLAALEVVPANPDGWLSRIVTSLHSLKARAQDRKVSVESLHTAIRSLLDPLPPLRSLTAEQLQAAVEAFPVVDADPFTISFVSDPLEHLAGALLLRHALKDATTDDRVAMMAMLAQQASDAIMELAHVRFFQLRLELLDEVIEHAPNQVEALRAKVSKANTISGLSASSTDGLQRVTALFAEAVVDARRLGDPDILANTVAHWALSLRPHALFEDSDGSLRRSALEQIDSALKLSIVPEYKSKLLHAKASVLSHPSAAGDPEATARILEEAVALAPHDRFRVDLERELADHLLQARRVAEAGNVLRRCLDQRDLLDGHELALLHTELGRVLVVQDETADAEQHLREALRLADGDEYWGYCGVRLAEFFVHQRRLDDALNLLRRVADLAGEMPVTHRWELWRWKMAVEWQAGDRSVAAQDRDQALTQAAGTVDEATVHALWAELDPFSPGSLRIALEYVSGDRGMANPHADRIIADLLSRHVPTLDVASRVRLLTWSQERRQLPLQSLLLESLGKQDAAVSILDEALVDGIDEVAMRLLKLGLMAEAPAGDLRREVEHIRSLVPDLAQLPLSALCNFAEACRLAADGDTSWLERSLRAWKLARTRSELSDPTTLPHIAWRTSYAVRDRVNATRLHSDPDLTPHLSHLEGLLPDLQPAHQQGLHELLGLLLFHGPLMHPTLREATGRLLRAAPEHPVIAELNARLESIAAAERDFEVSIWALPEAFRATTPFGDQPDPWLVRVVATGVPSAPPAHMLDKLEDVFLACKVRPDRADALLCGVAGVLDTMSPEQLGTFAEIAVLIVQEAPMGKDTWPLLYAAATGQPPASPEHQRLVHHLRRARLDQESQPEAPENEDPRSRFDEAIWHLDRSKQTQGEERLHHKQQALRKLKDLVDDEPGVDGVGFLISLGNAHRLDPDPDLDTAIECYECADGWAEQLASHELGRLHKVWADALYARGHDADFQSAKQHIQRALAHRRTGRLRTETLVTAAQIALNDPERDPATQARQAGELLLEATRCSPDGGVPYLTLVFHVLLVWRQRDPCSFVSSGAITELANRYPDRKQNLEEIERGVASNGLATDEQLKGHLVELVTTPSSAFYLKHANALDALLGDPSEAAGPFVEDDIERLQRLRAELRLAPPEIAPGALTLIAEVTARLARLNSALVDEVRTATLTARDCVRATSLPRGAATLFLHRMSQIWCPANVVSDPVLDVDFAVELVEEAVILDGGEEVARRDLLLTLARTLRHRGGRNGRIDLARARRLLEKALTQDRRVGNSDSIANTLHLLGDLLQYEGDGDQKGRLQRVATLQREAVELSSPGPMKARYQGNLAWTLSCLGTQESDGNLATKALDEAEGLFRACLAVLPNGPHRDNVLQNQATARSMRAQHLGASADAIRLARERLDALGNDAHPEVQAKVRHNLADALLTSQDPNDLREALSLARQALQFRLPGRDPRQHWESAVMVGESLLQLARQGNRLSLQEWQLGREALRSAATVAADALGAGTELGRAARDLMEIALRSPSPARGEEWAEEAWEFLRMAMPYLLTDDQSAEKEARLATALTLTLAEHEGQHGLVGTVPGGVVLGAASSQRIIRWWLRADSAWRRRQRAMLELPPGLTADRALRWRAILGAGEPTKVVDALKEIHQDVPGWLTEEPDLDGTRRWLRQHDGLAIGAWPGEHGFLIAVVGKRPERDRVLLLRAPMLPGDEMSLADALRDARRRDEVLNGVVQWATETLSQRLFQFVGAPPKRLLWSPQGVLRLVPPSRLFGAVPTSVSASLAIAPPSTSRARSSRAVVIIANPRERDLGQDVIDKGAALATEMADARLVAAHGALWGPVAHPDAVDVPADARHVLEELDHAGVAVVIAHGHMSGPRDAWLHLLSKDGTEERLDVARLAENPAVVAGLRLILLSCETGRTGDQPHMPGGIAGTLLAAGAREVIAPLWPVTVPSALRLAHGLVQGLREGEPLTSVLARFSRQPGVPGPQLGRVSKEQRAAGAWDHAAFVSWVG